MTDGDRVGSVLFPRLVKGGLVQVDPETGQVLRSIALQYNPDTLTRTLQVQATSGEGSGDRSRGAAAARAPRSRRSSSRPRSTPTDALDDPDANPDAVELGIHPQLAALEALVHPRADDLQANDALAGPGRARGAAARGAADAVRLEQAARRPGPRHRPVGHRGGLRRRAEPDPRQGVASACASCRSTTSASSTAAARCSWRTCGTRRASPGARRRRSSRRWEWRASDARSAAGSCSRRGAVPTTSFPPTSRYAGVGVDGLGSRRRRAADRVPAPPVLPAPERLRAAATRYASSRATGATCSRRATSATPSCGGGWPTPTASIDPRELDRARSAGALRITLRRGQSRDGDRCLSPVRLQLLLGPGRAAAGAAGCPRRAPGGEGRVGLRRDAERLRADVPALEPVAAPHALPAHRRHEHPDPARRHRRHRSAASTDRADGRRDDATTRSAPTAARRRR